MARPPSFWATAWRGIRPHALAAVIDVGVSFTAWGMVLAAHIARVAMAAAGVDSEFVEFVALGEKYTFLAVFAGLFYRILLREYRNARGLNP
jgi:hypothetical protein